MDRINLKKIALSCIVLITTFIIAACPLANPLELRTVIEERVVAAGAPDIPDTEGPSGSLAIAGGSAYTNVLSPTLVISAVDVGGGSISQMMISNEATFSGMIWEPYTTSRVWTVTAGDALKTVYIRFKDNSGNMSSIYSDTIILDTVAPTIIARPIVNNSINFVRSTTTLTYTFSEAMKGTTITSTTAKLVTKPGSGSVTAVPTKPDSTHLAFTINSPGFYFGRGYALDLLAGITDLAGNPLPADRIDFTVENDVYENTGTAGAPTGNGYPNNPFFLWSTDPSLGVNRATSGQLNSQEYDSYLARTQLLDGVSDQDRYRLYIDCSSGGNITFHVYTTDSVGNATGILSAGQGVKFILSNSLSQTVLVSSSDLNLLKNDQNDAMSLSGKTSGYYTLVVYGDDSGRYYNVSWNEVPGI